MYKLINNAELVNYLRNIVINEKERVDEYFQILNIDSDKPYVYHLNTYQITAILSGEGIAIVDDKVVNLKENDILFMDKNTNHSFVCKGTQLELFHIHLPKEGIETDRYILLNNVENYR